LGGAVKEELELTEQSEYKPGKSLNEGTGT
jgi:hypothetical protein